MNAANDSMGLSHLLKQFFKSYLVSQRRVSRHTLSAYRDTYRVLLPFLASQSTKKIGALTLADLNAPHIIAYLAYLEEERGNSVATRNARLAAIRTFLNFAAMEVPDELPDINRTLAIPRKKKDRPALECLEREEVDALVAAPDKSSWSGRRDHVLLLTMYNTGARVSEITNIRRQDLDLNRQHSVLLHGKGRKERVVPLWKVTVSALKKWLEEETPLSSDTVFPNRYGEPLTRFGVRQRLQCACQSATKGCPSLARRQVTPHSFRHATALHLLQSGVDLSVIALWLGHEQIETTHQYMEANLTMKKAALDSMQPIDPGSTKRYKKPSDELLAFLESL